MDSNCWEKRGANIIGWSSVYIYIYSKVETGLFADWVYFAPFQTDTQVTVLLCWALSDLKTPILFLLSLRLNTALHYALLALLSLSTLVFRNNMCHCLSVWDVLIARWAVDISQFSNHSELHWWDLKGRNRTVCRLSLYIYIYICMYVCMYMYSLLFLFQLVSFLSSAVVRKARYDVF